MQPQRRCAADGADSLPPIRYRAHVRAGSGEPEAAEIFLKRSMDLPRLQLLALRLLHVQLSLFRDLRFVFLLCFSRGREARSVGGTV